MYIICVILFTNEPLVLNEKINPQASNTVSIARCIR